MEEISGALSFNAVVNDSDFKESVNGMEKKIKSFGLTAEKAGDSMDSAFKKIYKGVEDFSGVTAENLAIQKQVIKEIEANLAKVKEKLDNIAPGRAKLEVIGEYQRLNGELEREKETFYELEQAVKQNEAAHSSLHTQLRKLRDDMAIMESSGQRNSDAYRQMQEEASHLTEALADVNRQTRIIGASNSIFQGIISGLGGIAGAFSAAQGAAGLFSRENDNLQKLMLKVQSLMAITIGLQQVQQALNKDEAFMLVVVRKAKDALTASTIRLSTALGISNIAAKALMGTLTLGLSFALTALIAVWSRYSAAQAKARAEDKQFNDAVSENASKTIATFKQLQASYTALGNDMKAKEKFIKSNAEEFEKLGVQVDTVSDAENVLIKNAGAFEQAMMLKAKAIAAMELAAESYKGYLKEMAQAESDLVPWLQNAVTALGGGASGILASIQNIAMTSPEKRMFDSEELKKQGDEYVGLYQDYNKEIDSLNKKFDFRITPDAGKQKKDRDEFIENLSAIKAQYELYNKWISSNDQFLRETARYQFSSLLQEGSSYLDYLTRQRDALLAKAKRTIAEDENLKKLNDAIAELSKIPAVKDTGTDLFIESLGRIREEYDRFLTWVSSKDTILQETAQVEFAGLLAQGESYLDYLTKQRDLLLSKTTRTKTEDSNLTKLNDAIARETQGTVLDDFQKRLNDQVNAATSVLEVLQLIKAEKDALTGDDTDLTKQKQTILEEAQSDALKRAGEETKALLDDYAGYLAQKIEFEKTYLEKKQLLTLAASQATNDKERQLAQAALAALEAEKEKWALSSGDLQYDQFKQQYQDYYAERMAIIERANEDIIQLEAEGYTDIAEERRKALVRELEEMTTHQAEMKGKFSALILSYGNASAMLIREVIGQLEAINLTGITTEKMEEVKKAISAAKKQLSKTDFFDMSYIKEQQKKLAAETDLTKQTQIKLDIEEAVNEKNEQGLTYAQQLVDVIADQNKELTAQMQLMNNMIGIVAQLAKGNYAGAAIGALASIIQYIGGLQQAQEMQDKFNTEKLINSLDRLSEMLAQQEQLVNAAFGVDKIQAFNDALDQVIRNIVQTVALINELARDAKVKLQISLTPPNLYRGYFDAQGYDEVFNKQVDSALAQLEANKDAIDAIYQYMFDNWDTISEEERERLQASLDAYKQYYDALLRIKQEREEYLTGTTADSVARGIVDGFRRGWDSAKDFADNFEEMMTNAILQSFINTILNPAVQAWTDQWVLAMKDNVLTKEEEEALLAGYNAIIETTKGWIDVFEQTTGHNFGFGEGASSNQMTGAIKGVSEETASLIAGQMNAMRLNQAQSLDLLRQQLISLAGIRENTDVLPDTLPQSLDQLKIIASNTGGALSLFSGTGIKVKF